jgi:AcrR family transcriptional regulator
MWQDRSTMASSISTAKSTRQRVPASERRDALIEAATHEFAHGGLYGTPVDRVARRVGVAQPYVFSLFGSKRELFLAAVHRSFQRVEELFTRAAQDYDPEIALPDATVLKALGHAYVQMLETDRDQLLLQHQAYAACGDDVVREAVRRDYARLVAHVQELSGATEEEIDDFMRYGMWLNVAAAMGVPDLSVGCEWVRDELAGGPAGEV